MNDLTPPTSSHRDHLHTAVKIAIGAVPVVGGAAAEVFNAVCESPIERERQDWRHAVATALKNGCVSKDIEVLSALAKAMGVQLVDIKKVPGMVDGELCLSTSGKFYRWNKMDWNPTDE